MHSLIARSLLRLRPGVFGAGVVAFLLTGCAVHDSTPAAAPFIPTYAATPTAQHNGGGAKPGPATSTNPGTTGAAPTTHSGSSTGTATKTGAGAAQGDTTPNITPADALLTAKDVGAHWGQVVNSNGPVTSSDKHQYCGAEFTSDRSLTTDAQTTLARNTDGLRVEEEAAKYSGSGATTAMSEYRAAFAQCRHYTTGSGADALTIQIDPVAAPKYGDDAVAVLMTLSQGSLVEYAHEVMTRQGSLVVLASVVSDNQSTVASNQSWLIDLADRHAQMRGA